MVAVNILIYSNMLSKIHSLKHVVWIGSHVDILHYMQMSEVFKSHLTLLVWIQSAV